MDSNVMYQHLLGTAERQDSWSFDSLTALLQTEMEQHIINATAEEKFFQLLHPRNSVNPRFLVVSQVKRQHLERVSDDASLRKAVWESVNVICRTFEQGPQWEDLVRFLKLTYELRQLEQYSTESIRRCLDSLLAGQLVLKDRTGDRTRYILGPVSFDLNKLPPIRRSVYVYDKGRPQSALIDIKLVNHADAEDWGILRLWSNMTEDELIAAVSNRLGKPREEIQLFRQPGKIQILGGERTRRLASFPLTSAEDGLEYRTVLFKLTNAKIKSHATQVPEINHQNEIPRTVEAPLSFRGDKRWRVKGTLTIISKTDSTRYFHMTIGKKTTVQQVRIFLSNTLSDVLPSQIQLSNQHGQPLVYTSTSQRMIAYFPSTKSVIHGGHEPAIILFNVLEASQPASNESNQASGASNNEMADTTAHSQHEEPFMMDLAFVNKADTSHRFPMKLWSNMNLHELSLAAQAELARQMGHHVDIQLIRDPHPIEVDVSRQLLDLFPLTEQTAHHGKWPTLYFTVLECTSLLAETAAFQEANVLPPWSIMSEPVAAQKTHWIDPEIGRTEEPERSSPVADCWWTVEG